MTERFVNPADLGGWADHYHTPDGSRHVAHRRSMYDFMIVESPSELDGPIDFDIETIATLEYLRLQDPKHPRFKRHATVYDVGCSYPYSLQAFQLDGHQGPLIGADPAAKQFREYNFWLPSDERIINRLVTEQKKTNKIGDIILIETDAENLVVADSSVEVVTCHQSPQHFPDIDAGFAEMMRILTPDGILVTSANGTENKKETRVIESITGSVMEEISGQKYAVPAPTNAGFTSEDAAQLLPTLFEHVSELRIRGSIVIRNLLGTIALVNCLQASSTSYKNEAGQPPDPELFSLASAIATGPIVSRIMRSLGKESFVDVADRSLFFASNAPMKLPPYFEAVPRH